jgi:hypothetical protein
MCNWAIQFCYVVQTVHEILQHLFKASCFYHHMGSLFCCLQVMTFPGTCGACAAACVTHMYVTSILIYNPTACD